MNEQKKSTRRNTNKYLLNGGNEYNSIAQLNEQ
jgi:hypothetical protein